MATALIPEFDKPADLLEIERLREIVDRQQEEIEALRITAEKYDQLNQKLNRKLLAIEEADRNRQRHSGMKPGDVWYASGESNVRVHSAECSQRKIGKNDGECYDMTCKRHGVQPSDWRNGFGPY